MRMSLPDHWPLDQYQLIDCGQGRKLERFGRYILDRPCPAADALGRSPGVDWSQADCRLGADGKAPGQCELEPWQVRFGDLVFNLHLTPFGHLGLFPEQAASWRWLTQQLMIFESRGEPAKALNLFGYTGGTTLALARAGAQVVHVDASAPAVTWARHNAQASGLQQTPIRWIVEDARKFAERELRRGKRYDVIVMDPPTYGHGPKGKPWAIAEHLPELARACTELLRQDGQSRLLVTAHSELPAARDVAEMVSAAAQPHSLSKGRLGLVDQQARELDAGFFVRAGF